MALDLDKFKGKTLDDALFTELQAGVTELTTRAETAEGKARTAQKESIDGRKAIKAERDAAFERLGVTTMEELQALPEAKGQADAVKQLEGQIKKLTKERDDLATENGEMKATTAKQAREAAISKAVSKHQFIDPEDAAALIGLRVKDENGELRFDAGDGKLVPLDDGAAWLAKSKPHLVKAAGGQGGSGYQPQGNGSGKPPTKPERKDFKDETAYFRAAAEYAAASQQTGASH